MKIIMLTKGYATLVDDADFNRFGHLKWCSSWNKDTNLFYAIRGWRENGKRKFERLHRAIMGVTDPKVKVDHRNHDTLDNRSANLRVCTVSQNARNLKGSHRDSKSGLRGVSWNARNRAWAAEITVEGKRLRLGYFSDKGEAAAAYAAANRKHFGDFGGQL